MKPLEKEFDYYLDNQEALVKEYDGQFIVIKGEQVIGSYETENEAIKETTLGHELGTFLVQFVEAGKQHTHITLHPRIIVDKEK